MPIKAPNSHDAYCIIAAAATGRKYDKKIARKRKRIERTRKRIGLMSEEERKNIGWVFEAHIKFLKEKIRHYYRIASNYWYEVNWRCDSFGGSRTFFAIRNHNDFSDLNS